ncbi:MAG: AAA family ATPase, partial [Anaerolineaceae bacterium]
MESTPSGRDPRDDCAPKSAIGAKALSARQREVLALVAAGLTNRGISERLVISLGTADRHVHNILAKLGCNNRTEAAAFGWKYLPDVPHALGPPGAPNASFSAGRFIGRPTELQRLAGFLREAGGGRGSLTMIEGEPGIGKTRLIEESARQAHAAGFTVLRGRCYEGDWAPPYVPFAEALASLVKQADLRELRTDLGFGGAPLGRIAPVVRERLPDLPEPAPLGPKEEQFRILDAVLQILRATSNRRPMLFVIDDLHWADAGTLNMLRYVSRFLTESRICLLGSYRHAELDRSHPLGDALADLRGGAGYERISLGGLDGAEVGEMLESIAGYEVADELVDAIFVETGGNPLFVREMVLHLIEDGTVSKRGEQSSAVSGLAIPETVRQVIGRRLSRLSDDGNRLLSAASAFNGPFRFDIAAEAAEVEEGPALAAIDAAIRAQLIQASGTADTFEFTHALIAHTLYSELNPSRQVRLHRRIATALESRLQAPAAEVAYQYQRSAALPGSEAGVAWALRAADEAAAAYAWEKVVALCEAAVELMPPGDGRRDETTGRLGLALPCLQRCDDAIAAMKVWATTLFAQGRAAEGLEYLMLGHRALVGTGYEWEGFELAHFAEPHLLGLDNRPSVWFRLLLLRDAEESSPDYVGLTLGPPEKVELFRAWDALPNLDDTTIHRSAMRTYGSRAEVLAWPRTYPLWSTWAVFQAGEFREAEGVLAERAAASLRMGMLDEAAQQLVFRAACHISLGNFALARELLTEAARLVAGAPNSGA